MKGKVLISIFNGLKKAARYITNLTSAVVTAPFGLVVGHINAVNAAAETISQAIIQHDPITEMVEDDDGTVAIQVNLSARTVVGMLVDCAVAFVAGAAVAELLYNGIGYYLALIL